MAVISSNFPSGAVEKAYLDEKKIKEKMKFINQPRFLTFYEKYDSRGNVRVTLDNFQTYLDSWNYEIVYIPNRGTYSLNNCVFNKDHTVSGYNAPDEIYQFNKDGLIEFQLGTYKFTINDSLETSYKTSDTSPSYLLPVLDGFSHMQSDMHSDVICHGVKKYGPDKALICVSQHVWWDTYPDDGTWEQAWLCNILLYITPNYQIPLLGNDY